MSKFVELRDYPHPYLSEYAKTRKNLIRLPQPSSDSAAPSMLRAKGSLPDEKSPFLTETADIKPGHAYSVFEVKRLFYDTKTHMIDLDADVSFTKICEEITLYADILDMENDRVLASFEHETVTSSNTLEYQIKENFGQTVPEEYLAVILCASWKSPGAETESAAIIRQIGGDITYGMDLTYPKKELQYVKFPNNSTLINQTPPNIPALFQDSREDNIQIALFREPRDGRALDYLCEFGKDRMGHPYLGVPTLFSIWLDSSTTSFCTQKPVNVTFTIASLDPSAGGRYVVAAGSSFTTTEEIQVTAKEKEIEVKFVTPWKVPFPYGGSVRPYDFSYEVIMELYTITEGQTEPVLQPSLIAVSSRRNEGECLQKIPDISIRWGCLKEGTKIEMADKSQKPVEQICIGDSVRNPEGCFRIKNVWKGVEDSYIELATEDGRQLSVTKDHPILTVEGWKPAKEIQKDTEILTEDGNRKVKAVKEVKARITVYNFSLDETAKEHSIFAEGILVGDFEKQNGR